MADVFTLIIDEVHLQLADASLPYGVFRLSQQQHEGQRRVIWIPTNFDDQPLRTANPVTDSDGVKRTAMLREEWQVECHITGTSFEDSEEIRKRVIFQTRKMFGIKFRAVGGVFTTQAADDAALMQGGAQKVIQRFVVELLMFPPEPLTPQVTTIKSIETTAETTVPADSETFIVPPL